MTPMEIFEICKESILGNVRTCGGNPSYRYYSGEILGARLACNYLDGADRAALTDAANEALAELREVVTAEGGGDWKDGVIRIWT